MSDKNLKYMIAIFFICIITILVNLSIKKVVGILISKSKSAAYSVKVRTIYRYIRLCIIVIYTLVILTELYFLIPVLWDSVHHITAVRLTVIFIILSLLPYASMSLPISGMTLDKLKGEEFALYLRGFSCDSYEASMYDKIDAINERKNMKITKRKKKNVMELPFSERDFAKAVKRFMPIYSVGMTKEIESPEGSKRIYLDDEDWQDGVKLLMEKAKIVFILVNPTKSCIWEILKSQELAMEKTVFFVDNPDYINMMKDKMEYSTIPECVRYTGRHTYNYMIDGKCHSYVYTNNEMGFLNVLRAYFDDKEPSEKRENELLKIEDEKQQCDYSRYMPH